MNSFVDDLATWSRRSSVRVFVEPSAQPVDVDLEAGVKALARTARLLRLAVCRLAKRRFVVVVAFVICLARHVAQTEVKSSKKQTDVFSFFSEVFRGSFFSTDNVKGVFFVDEQKNCSFMAATYITSLLWLQSFFHFSSFSLSYLFSFFFRDREWGFHLIWS